MYLPLQSILVIVFHPTPAHLTIPLALKSLLLLKMEKVVPRDQKKLQFYSKILFCPLSLSWFPI